MNPVSLFLTKNSLIKVALTEVLIVSSHVTDDNIDVEFALDGLDIQVHPKFAHQEIMDLTFPNKQALVPRPGMSLGCPISASGGTS